MRIWIDNRHPHGLISDQTAQGLVERILLALALPDAEVSVVLVDDREMARMNRRFLNRRGPTNVIAFSMREGDGKHISPHLLGDVVVSLDTARREAEEGGIAWEVRLAALVIHGVLHLLGRDHVGDEAQARRMADEEERILAALGVHGRHAG
jgi:probable rRNA maturation factor